MTEKRNHLPEICNRFEAKNVLTGFAKNPPLKIDRFSFIRIIELYLTEAGILHLKTNIPLPPNFLLIINCSFKIFYW